MKFSDRLRRKRKLLGLTQQKLANNLGYTKVAISRWEQGHSIPNGEKLESLANMLECSASWLLDGIDEPQCDNYVMVKYFYDIEAAAGNGFSNCNSEHEMIAVPRDIVDIQAHKEDVCCIRINGDSMEPVLYHGSIIALNPHKKVINDGMMYVIRQEDLLRVKILVEKPLEIIVRSYNSNYSDEIYKKDNLENFEVIGQVFWYSSSITI
ncbi:XRE family transcriptional regulator [Photobacterium damselae]|uniref:XRE family transcriptional regulator n=1 Tax=Photobacterium damselae TaxID=38293 RepID=UPI0010FED89B|nr:S24 family peptidase [Photobacterium damselae]TLS79812.1 helix-turn-helix transcriptional regulator [Photobacterium damselae subsp. damselae]TLS89938.1 helix-turn-helix transcriptional regulator [Photobacterium damselae subsp. damselae]